MRRVVLGSTLLAVAACGGSNAPATPDAAPDAPHGPDLLPCDVREVLADRCAGCHSSPVSAGAPSPLRARDDFFAPSTVDGEDLIARSLARLHDDADPMPPASEPAPDAAQLATLVAWLEAGAPAGTCAALPDKPQATTCASASRWTQGETGSIDMQPGVACRACHDLEAPLINYFFAGTVYGALHEEDLCNSPPPDGARVEILDHDGNVTMTLLPNPSGNFMSTSVTAGVPTPYTARVVVGDQQRTMITEQTSGDCNGCHTEQGGHTLTPADQDDAPGRIVWPTAPLR